MKRVRVFSLPVVSSLVAAGALSLPGALVAGEIKDSYATNQTLTVEMMNNIKSAVNDNHSRVGAMEQSVSTLESQTADLQQIRDAVGALTATQTCAGNNADDVMVRVGVLCVDKYEASLWRDRTATAATASVSECAGDGGDCSYVAQSRAAVTPVSRLTYLQAVAACANAGKRLLTPGEFQMAALGTPPDMCNVSTSRVAATGASANCVSRDHGNGQRVNDMVGNLYEFVDAAVATAAGSMQVGFMGSAYDTATGTQQANAQRFFTNANPTATYPFIGFRCAR